MVPIFTQKTRKGFGVAEKDEKLQKLWDYFGQLKMKQTKKKRKKYSKNRMSFASLKKKSQFSQENKI